MKKLILFTCLLCAFSFFVKAQQDSLSIKKDTLGNPLDSLILSDSSVTIPNQKVVFLISESSIKNGLAGGEANRTRDQFDPFNPPLEPQPNSLNATVDAGRTTGLLEVTSTGGANYTVPISIPPGINNVSPKISIAYNSQSGNGAAGYGWNIGGISMITRIPAVKYIDGYVGSVNNDANDKFALDGQRLILVSGVYGQNNAEYKTENYSNLKIISKTYFPGGGPIYFEVFYPDGSKALYGSDYSSNTIGQLGIDYLENPQGLRINYFYTNTGNNLQINQITYGSLGNTTGLNQINFIYKTRLFKEQFYVAGIATYNDKILSEINVIGNGIGYRNYILTHDQIASLNYERVNSLTEMNGDKTRSFEPIYFYYENPSNNINDIGPYSNLGITGVASNNSNIITGDFTGNGTMDFLIQPTSKNKVWLYRDPDFSSPFNLVEEVNTGNYQEVFPINWLTFNNKLFPSQAFMLVKQDFNTSEIEFEVRTTAPYAAGLIQYEKFWTDPPKYDSYYSECTGDYVGGTLPLPMKYLSGDFNGDGLSDLIAITKPYLQTTYERAVTCDDGYNTCCEQDSYLVNNANAYFVNLDRRITTSFTNFAGVLNQSLNGSEVYTADFNGDGKTDIIQIKAGAVTVYSLNNNNNLVEIINQVGSFTNSYPPLFGDYNGDGKTDLILPISASTSAGSNFNVYISTGQQFVQNTQYFPFSYTNPVVSGGNIDAYTLIPTDINGDGKTDIIRLYTKTYNSTTQGTLSITTYTNKGVSSSTGLLQLSYENNVTKNTYLKHYPIPLFSSSQRTNFKLEFGLFSDNTLNNFNFNLNVLKTTLLNTIYQDGVYHTVNYKDLIPDPNFEEIQIYTDSYDQTYPYVDVHSAPGLNVVSRVSKYFNGVTTKQVFGYQGAVSHADGLGFIGFGQTIKSNFYKDDEPSKRLFNINVFDVQNRGTISKTFTTNSAYLNPSLLGFNLGAPTFDGNGDPIINNPSTGINDGGSIADYINRTDYVYSSQTLSNQVFVNVPLVTATKDILNGTNTSQVNTYDAYYNISKTFQNFNGDGTKKTEITYDNNLSTPYYIGRPVNQKVTMTNAIDSYSTEEQMTYTGYLPTQIKRKGNGTPFMTENLQYDAYGNVIRKGITDPNNIERASLMQYDASGRFLIKGTDLEGLETNYTYDAYTGNVLTVTSPYGLTTTSIYDAWGRLSQNTNYLGKNSYRTYTKSGSDIITYESDEQGKETYTTINALGQTVEIKSKDVTGQFNGKAFQYDAYGRQIKESEPAYGSNYTQWIEKNFDNFGRINQITTFTGKISNITYNGLTTSVNDGTKTMSNSKNGLGQVVSAQDPGGVISYTYFANGNLKSSSFDGSTQTIEQDGWGRKTQLVDPSAGTYTYQYNHFGDLTLETNLKGNTAYTYDNNGKIQSKRILGDDTDMSYQYTYDGTSKLLSAISLTNADGNNTVYTYNYDTYKRLYQNIEDNTLATFTKTFTFDGFGRVQNETSLALNKGNSKSASKTVTNNYQNGDLFSIVDAGTGENIWQVNGVNARGQVTSAYLANYMMQQTNTYDQYGLAQEMKTDRIGGTPSELMRLNFSFNAQRGILDSRSNSVFGWNENFIHDSQDRLTNFNDNNGLHNQVYDNRGRISSNSKLGSYVYSGSSYQQIGMNNLTQTAIDYYNVHRLQQISYNAFKSPVQISEQGKEKISFEYNGAMQRAHRYYGDEATEKSNRRFRKSYSEDGSVEITYDQQTGNTTFVFYMGGDAYSAPAIWKEENNSSNQVTASLYYLYRDYLGSILLITDNQGISKEQRHFDAWGNIVKLTDGNGNNLADFAILDRGYTGHEHLTKVGLIHMNGRLYDPLLRRFLSPDNFVQDPYNSQNYNRYGYVFNSPLKYSDPSGEIAFAALAPVIVKGLIKVGLLAAKGAAIAAAGYTASVAVSTGGFSNWNWSQFGKAVGVGALTGIASGGLGLHFGEFLKYGWAGEIVRAGGHAFANGFIAEFTGGDFMQSFASAGLGSLAGSGFQGLTQNLSGTLVDVGTIGFSAVSGGIGAELTGGDFWRGAAVAAIVAGLNHLGNHGFNSDDDSPYGKSASEIARDWRFWKDILLGEGEFALPENNIKLSVENNPLSWIMGGSAKTGITVLGHYPEYIKLAESLAARRFSIPTNIWNKMSETAKWAANQKFLDRLIIRGDRIRLATPINQVKPGSFFQKELNYLFNKGYTVSPNGKWLIK